MTPMSDLLGLLAFFGHLFLAVYRLVVSITVWEFFESCMTIGPRETVAIGLRMALHQAASQGR